MNPIDDCFLSRAEVMRRWRISIATIKRRERQGILRPIRMSTHVIRYRLSDVVRAEDDVPVAEQGRRAGDGPPGLEAPGDLAGRGDGRHLPGVGADVHPAVVAQHRRGEGAVEELA